MSMDTMVIAIDVFRPHDHLACSAVDRPLGVLTRPSCPNSACSRATDH